MNFISDKSNPLVIITGAGYGLNNMGDEAFLSVIIQRFRKQINNARIIVLSFNPGETRRIHNVESSNALGLYVPFLIMKANKIVLGGGGIFDTYLGGSINKTSYYSMMISLFGIILRKDVIFYAIGANVLASSWIKTLLPIIMNNSYQIKVRDTDSKNVLQSIGVNKDIEVIGDPAIDLDADKKIGKRVLLEQGIELDNLRKNNKMLIGLGLRSTGEEKVDKEIVDSFSKLYDWLIEKNNVEIIFIPMAVGGKRSENDIIFADRIKSSVKNKDKFKIITSGLTPIEVKSIVSCLQLMIGMRLHSLIFANSTNIPLIGIAYSPKVSAFLKSVGKEKECIDINDVTFERLKEEVAKNLNN